MTQTRPDSYLDALLQRNHNLAYKFPEGYMFFRVEDYEDTVLNYNEYNVLTTESSSATIGSASTGKNWNTWTLNNSLTYDIFHEGMSGFMLQTFLGIDPPSLKVWRQIPAPTPRGNLDQTKITTLNDDAPGFLTGHDESSPYDMPSVLSEMIIPSNFPQIQTGIYNPEGISVMPRFKVIFRRMKVQAYNPQDQMDRNTINDIISGRRHVKVYSPGLDGYQYDHKREYGVDVLPWRTVAGSVM